jgi:hypothetical protein
MASEHTRVKFKDTFSGLPSRAPDDHAHIVDESSFDAAKNQDIKLWDAIVTTILRESFTQLHSVMFLEQFLDLSKPRIRLALELEYSFDDGLPLNLTVVIMRHGREVIVGIHVRILLRPPC